MTGLRIAVRVGEAEAPTGDVLGELHNLDMLESLYVELPRGTVVSVPRNWHT